MTAGKYGMISFPTHSKIPMLDTLKTHFGFSEFRPLQEPIIRSILDKKDTVVLMPTGGGKSLCYQLPALIFEGITLVVSPLIALMKDQVDALQANGISAAFLNSTLDLQEMNDRIEAVRQGKIKILYVAPERLALPHFREFLQDIPLSLVAIDEAHCISEWGHDFRPDYRNLKSLRSDFAHVPIVALTATATERVRNDIIRELHLENPQVFFSTFNRENLHYAVVPKQDAFEKLTHFLYKHKNESAIIYCFSRKDTEELAQDLKKIGLKALPYHAGLEHDLRRSTQEKFIRDEVPIIVATIAFGMGIDKPNVRLIVHYDLPKSIEGYYQETGRAGRDGIRSECILFYSSADVRKHKFFIDQIQNENEKKHSYKKLHQVIEYAEQLDCRRKTLIEYFGESWNQENCSLCDNCLLEKEKFDGTQIAQKILSAVYKTGERYGTGHVIKVLLGKRDKKVKEKNHHTLSVYGIVQDFSPTQLQSIIAQLLKKNFLVKDTEHSTLALTNEGKVFLKEKQTLDLIRIKRKDEPLLFGDIDYDQVLFEQLRKKRLQIAAELGVPPFIVFGDVSLQQMALYFPQSHESFLQISGVGEEKLKRFGDLFLEVICAYALEHNISEKVNGQKKKQRRLETTLQ